MKNEFVKVMAEAKKVMEYPWHDPAFYAAMMAQTYYYTSRGTRILLLAASHTPMTDQKTHRRLSVHANEEKGHEQLAKKDVEDLGFSLSDIPEFPSTKAFYATQYYNIQHISVESLFGWILFLEGLALEHGKTIRSKLQETLSDPPTRFLDVHIEEDPGHVDQAFGIMEAFSHKGQKEIVENLYFSVDGYLKILDHCREFANQQNLKAQKAV